MRFAGSFSFKTADPDKAHWIIVQDHMPTPNEMFAAKLTPTGDGTAALTFHFIDRGQGVLQGPHGRVANQALEPQVQPVIHANIHVANVGQAFFSLTLTEVWGFLAIAPTLMDIPGIGPMVNC